MNPSPTGLRLNPPSSSELHTSNIAISAVSSAAVAGVGVGLVIFGATHLDPAAVLPGVALAVEGTVSLATLAAGGSSYDVVQIREGFKFSSVNLVETGVFKGIEAAISFVTNEAAGKEISERLSVIKNVASFAIEKPGPEGLVDTIKNGAELAKFLSERAAQLYEQPQSQTKNLETSSDTSEAKESENTSRNSEIMERLLDSSGITRPEGERKFSPNF